MSQIKTEKHLTKEFLDANLNWWMAAAAKTISDAKLGEVFEANYRQAAAATGHPDIFKEMTFIHTRPHERL